MNLSKREKKKKTQCLFPKKMTRLIIGPVKTCETCDYNR